MKAAQNIANIRSFVVNLSCHENGLERPVLRTEISDLVLNFFSYEDGGKLILRINLGIEHFDTHAVCNQLSNRVISHRRSLSEIREKPEQ